MTEHFTSIFTANGPLPIDISIFLSQYFYGEYNQMNDVQN